MSQRPGFMARSRRIETMTRAIGARSRTLKWLATVDIIVKLAVLYATAAASFSPSWHAPRNMRGS